MKIKHYDHDLQKWVIDGVSNSSDLELSNPAYLDNEGNSISVDQGFTKIANKIKNIEDNLAWVYINGARGGGDGGGGGTGDSITIQVLEEVLFILLLVQLNLIFLLIMEQFLEHLL